MPGGYHFPDADIQRLRIRSNEERGTARLRWNYGCMGSVVACLWVTGNNVL